MKTLLAGTRGSCALVAVAVALGSVAARAQEAKPAAEAKSGEAKAEETRKAEASAEGEAESGKVTQAAAPARTLAERIPSVTRRVFVKQGRVELFPSVGLTLNDPFFDHVVGTLGLSFHVLESLSVGVAGDYYGSLRAQVPVFGSTQKPGLNRPVYAGRLELTWAPLYGKLSLLAESVLHFDFFLVGGAGMIATKRGDPTVAAVVGIGQHYFVADWLALRIELRDQFFRMSRGDAMPARTMQNLLSAMFGFCLYLPSEFEREAL